MSAVAPLLTVADIEVESDVVAFLKPRGRASAEELVAAITNADPYLSRAAVVSAVWRLAEAKAIRVQSDWTIELLPREKR